MRSLGLPALPVPLRNPNEGSLSVKMTHRHIAGALALLLLLVASALGAPDGSGDRPLAFKGATLLPISGDPIPNGTIVIRRGLIEEVGPSASVAVPADAETIDASGKWIMPGIIDAHSHMGVYSWPGVDANSDGNEATAPVTAQIRAEDSVNLEDPAFARARAGGVTTVLVLPGSANIIGGEGVVLRLVPGALLEGMKFPGAPRHLKMAMGENPKRVYGGKGQVPSTRMGIMAVLRENFTKAVEYQFRREKYEREKKKYDEKMRKYPLEKAEAEKKGAKFEDEEPEAPVPPEHDALCETLVDVMQGRVRVQVHCYRKDDILDIIRISDEFGFRITALHHALEAYKVADELAQRGIACCTWPDWWGFKMEAYDATPLAPTILQGAGVLVVFKSDSSDLVQRMYTEAAKGVKYGLTEREALAAITLNPAKVLGVDEWVGSLEKGKRADIAVFSKSPLDATTLCELTLIDGRVVFDRAAADAARDRKEYGR